MTQINVPNLPIPVDAIAGEWTDGSDEYPEDWLRTLTWSRFDAAGVVVAVQGAQYADGRIDRFVYLNDVPDELTSPLARHLAAALLNAADALDGAQ